jgi:glycosyltransferase involved in cell wall biosynthesis
MMQYSVVVPAYNEEENISHLVAKIKVVMEQLSSDWELILIDDGSKDHTLQKMEEERRKDQRVKIIRFRRNFGQSVGWQAVLITQPATL